MKFTFKKIYPNGQIKLVPDDNRYALFIKRDGKYNLRLNPGTIRLGKEFALYKVSCDQYAALYRAVLTKKIGTIINGVFNIGGIPTEVPSPAKESANVPCVDVREKAMEEEQF